MATGESASAEDEELDSYIMTDQPEECRKCGTRTEILREENEYQIHLCPKCDYRYKLTEDDTEEDDGKE